MMTSGEKWLSVRCKCAGSLERMRDAADAANVATAIVAGAATLLAASLKGSGGGRTRGGGWLSDKLKRGMRWSKDLSPASASASGLTPRDEENGYDLDLGTEVRPDTSRIAMFLAMDGDDHRRVEQALRSQYPSLLLRTIRVQGGRARPADVRDWVSEITHVRKRDEFEVLLCGVGGGCVAIDAIIRHLNTSLRAAPNDTHAVAIEPPTLLPDDGEQNLYAINVVSVDGRTAYRDPAFEPVRAEWAEEERSRAPTTHEALAGNVLAWKPSPDSLDERRAAWPLAYVRAALATLAEPATSLPSLKFNRAQYVGAFCQNIATFTEVDRLAESMPQIRVRSAPRLPSGEIHYFFVAGNRCEEQDLAGEISKKVRRALEAYPGVTTHAICPDTIRDWDLTNGCMVYQPDLTADVALWCADVARCLQRGDNAIVVGHSSGGTVASMMGMALKAKGVDTSRLFIRTVVSTWIPRDSWTAGLNIQHRMMIGDISAYCNKRSTFLAHRQYVRSWRSIHATYGNAFFQDPRAQYSNLYWALSEGISDTTYDYLAGERGAQLRLEEPLDECTQKVVQAASKDKSGNKIARMLREGKFAARFAQCSWAIHIGKSTIRQIKLAAVEVLEQLGVQPEDGEHGEWADLERREDDPEWTHAFEDDGPPLERTSSSLDWADQPVALDEGDLERTTSSLDWARDWSSGNKN